MNDTEQNDKTTPESIEHDSTRQSSMLLNYRVATLSDCRSLCVLVNNGSRGELSRQGWTTEDALLEGQRTDIETVVDMINDDNSIFLVFLDQIETSFIGCVYLKHRIELKSAYLGMLTVRPDLQARGYGKFILSTAETYAVNNWSIDYIELMVITHRIELIAFYNRRGYTDIGRRIPYPAKYGIPKGTDVELCALRKYINKTEEERLKQISTD